nr:uncharacterized protein LOC121502100 [Drosophila kikkawai]
MFGICSGLKGRSRTDLTAELCNQLFCSMCLVNSPSVWCFREFQLVPLDSQNIAAAAHMGLDVAKFVVVAGHHTTTTREWDASRWVVSSHGERALKDVNPSPVQQSGCAAASNKEVQGL